MHLIDTDQMSQFFYKPMLDVLTDLEIAFGPQVITSLYRINDTGVHGQLPLRGVDIRCRNIESGCLIADWLNDRWSYDNRRPWFYVAVAHGEGANFHIHLQVHPNTQRRD